MFSSFADAVTLGPYSADEKAAIANGRYRHPDESQRALARRLFNESTTAQFPHSASLIGRSVQSIYSALRRFDARVSALKSGDRKLDD